MTHFITLFEQQAKVVIKNGTHDERDNFLNMLSEKEREYTHVQSLVKRELELLENAMMKTCKDIKATTPQHAKKLLKEMAGLERTFYVLKNDAENVESFLEKLERMKFRFKTKKS